MSFGTSFKKSGKCLDQSGRIRFVNGTYWQRAAIAVAIAMFLKQDPTMASLVIRVATLNPHMKIRAIMMKVVMPKVAKLAQDLDKAHAVKSDN